MKTAATAWLAPLCPPNQMRMREPTAMAMAIRRPAIETASRLIAAGVLSEANWCKSTVKMRSWTKKSAMRRAQTASCASLTA